MTVKNDQTILIVDCVIFGPDRNELKVFLDEKPAGNLENEWGLPAEFVREKETLDDAAHRIFNERFDTGNIFLEQLQTFSTNNSEGRTVTVSYYGLMKLDKHFEDQKQANPNRWFFVKQVPDLSENDKAILNTAIFRFRQKIRFEPLGFYLLPAKFTLIELQQIYEVILDKKLDIRTFREKMWEYDLLVPLDATFKDKNHRMIGLYRFNKKKYFWLKKHGFYLAF